ncbi:MAG: hypothetical protein ACJ75R_02750 [Solirubrobacterales bacterium]
MRTGWIFRALGLAAVVTLALAANAFAGGRLYEGAIGSDDATSVSLKVKKVDGTRWVTSFVARNFIIACENGVEARLGSAQVRALPGTIAVHRGHFAAKVAKGPRTVEISGRFTGSSDVSGTVHYTGLTTVTLNGQEQTLDCQSDVLGWHASRAQTTGRISASTP